MMILIPERNTHASQSVQSVPSVICGSIYGLRDCESFLELFNGVIDYTTGAV